MTAKTKSAAKRKAVGAKSKRPKLALQEQIDLLAGLTAKLAQRVSALECPSPLLLDIEADVKKLSDLYASLPQASALSTEAAQSGVSPSAPADLASDPNTIAMHDLRKP